jgi:hypothetical protein
VQTILPTRTSTSREQERVFSIAIAKRECDQDTAGALPFVREQSCPDGSIDVARLLLSPRPPLCRASDETAAARPFRQRRRRRRSLLLVDRKAGV